MSTPRPRGTAISHYRIDGLLGAGGMGEVYEAFDSKLERPVALKILPAEVVRNEERVRRFVLEAKSASALSHPHIVTIYEIGEGPDQSGDGPLHFIAMELIRGETLREKLRAGEGEPREVVRWMSQVADGLAKAHAAGIIHRDLKPENIMITRDGYAKVLDFGLAKLSEPAGPATDIRTAVRGETGEGIILGTVGYMSPEQVQGKPVDHRSDIFSLGCVLYEAASGEKPFRGDSAVDVMHQILHAQPTPVKEIAPGIPPELRRIIRRCMAKDPEKRFQSMKDVALALSEVVEDWDELRLEGSSQSSVSREMPAFGRRRGLLLAGAAGAALLLLGGLLLVGDRLRPSEAMPQATFSQLTDFPGEELTPSVSPDGTMLVYVSAESGNRDIYLLRVGGSKPINLTESSPADDYQPAFAPDGNSIAFRSERDGGGIFLMGATGESVRRLGDFGYSPSFSPDGKQIVVCSERVHDPWNRFPAASLWVIDVASGQRTKLFEGDAVEPEWSPNGKRIAFWGLPGDSGQRDIATINSSGGDRKWVTSDSAFDFSPVWSADGKHLYFISDRGGSMNLWRVRIDPETGEAGEPQAMTTPARSVHDVSMSRDGNRAVFVSGDYRSHIYRLDFDPAAEQVVGGPYAVTRGSTENGAVSISPDGQHFVYNTVRAQEDLVVVRRDGGDLRRLTNDRFRDRGASWSPDGTRIAFYSDRSGSYDLWAINRDGSGLRQLTSQHPTTWFFPRWSPDGTRLVASTSEGAGIFRVPNEGEWSEPEMLPRIKTGNFFAGGFSPDGRRLVGARLSAPTMTDALIVYDFSAERYEILEEFLATAFGQPVWLDNRRAVYLAGTEVRVMDTETKRSKVIYQPPSGRPSNVTVSADGRTLGFLLRQYEADLWMATFD